MQYSRHSFSHSPRAKQFCWRKLKGLLVPHNPAALTWRAVKPLVPACCTFAPPRSSASRTSTCPILEAKLRAHWKQKIRMVQARTDGDE